MAGFGDFRKIEAGTPMVQESGGMEDFVSSFGFIIFFLILVLFVAMTLGYKALYAFLWLVLLGMVFAGWTKLEALVRRYA